MASAAVIGCESRKDCVEITSFEKPGVIKRSMGGDAVVCSLTIGSDGTLAIRPVTLRKVSD